MKYKQITAVLLSIILAASACVPINGLSAFAAENAGSTEAVQEQLPEKDAQEQLTEEEPTAESSEEAGAEEAFEADDAVETTEAAVATEIDGTSGESEPEETAGEDAEASGEAGTADTAETTGTAGATSAAEAAGTTEAADTAEGTDASEAVDATAGASDDAAADAADAAAAATASATAADAAAATTAPAQPTEMMEIIDSDGIAEGGSREAMGAARETLSVDDILSREIIPTDVSTASSGCVMVGLPGEYISDPDAALARINEIRWEACQEGVRNPNTGEPLTTNDYVAIKWSSDLEYIARIRAAESSLTGAHERTNGKSIWGISGPGGARAYGEVLAWNWSRSMITGINQWYGEKAYWVNQTPGEVTGHYTAMINPTNRYVGLGTFCSDEVYYYNTTAGEFTSGSGLDESHMSFTGECVQMLEMTTSNLGAGEIAGKLNGAPGETSKHLLATEPDFDHAYSNVYLMSGVTWSSSDTSVVTISSDGETTAVSGGSSTIRAASSDGSITAEGEFVVKGIKDCEIELSATSYVYDGTKKEPSVKVTYQNTELTKDTDYSVSYSDPVNAGTVTVTVTGMGEFGGSDTRTYVIEKAEQELSFDKSPLWIEADSSETVTVTGNRAAVSFESWDEDIVTVAAEGETSARITGVKQGTGFIIARAAGNNNYNSTMKSLYVTVTPISISRAEIAVTDAVYDGTAKKPGIEVTYGGKILTEGTDYSVTCRDNVNAGSYNVTISGTGDFKGSVIKTYTIEKAEQTLTAQDLNLHPYEEAVVSVTGAQGTLTYESADTAVAAVVEDETAMEGQAGTVTAGQAGTAQITVNAAETDNYKAGSVALTVAVTAYDLSSSDCIAELEADSFVYSGEARKPAVSSVKFGDVTLTEDTDYTVSYGENTNAGTGTVTITGNDKTTAGSKTLDFTITKAEQTFTAENLSLQPYEKAKVSVTGAQGTLTYQSADAAVASVSEDGTVTAGQAGSAQITVSASDTDNYNAGSAAMTVTVTTYDLSSSECTAELETDSYVYNGSARKPAVTSVKFGDITLTEGTDYTVTYGENINAGTGTVTITGNDKTTSGSKTLNFTITKAEQTFTAEDLSLRPYEKAKVSVTGAQGTLTYQSADTAVAAVVEDGTSTAGQAGTVTAGQAGTAQITVNAAETDNYKAGSVTLTVTVTAYDLSSSECIAKLEADSFIYNGEARKPAVASVKFGDVTLTEGTDYTVTYGENINAGTGTVTITGNDKTAVGSRTLSFTITKAEQTISADNVKIRVGEIRKIAVEGAQGALTYKIADPAFATVADDGTVTALAEGTTKLTVNAAQTDNYNAAEPIEITVEVRPATIDVSELEITVDDAGLVYNGKAQEPKVTVMYEGEVLTEGFTVEYENNVIAGDKTAKVIVKGDDEVIEGTKEVAFTILPGKTTRGDMFNLANNVKVTWKEVPGAKYYKVYREGVTDPSESLDEPVIVTERLIGWDMKPGLTNGHAYRYRIVASLTGKDAEGNLDPSGDSPLSYSKLMYRLKTVVIRSVKNTAPGKVTVKYDRTATGDSYVLQYCERQDMVGAKTKVVLGASNNSYVIGGLKKGKTYYISIRVRKKVDGIDYYTTFGVAKKIKITK